MATMIRLALLVVALFAVLQPSVAVTTHVVGNSTGWVVPPQGPIFYAVWSAQQKFILGDILFFNFTTGDQDVARVTGEDFLTCNSTNPISLIKTGPANFSLNSTGQYYFIGTLNTHCLQGQKLAINVTTSPAPTPIPAPRTVPENFTVGDRLGWIVPPLGEIFYLTWTYNKSFIVGDILVFNFRNGSNDVAVVTKDAYNSCNTSTNLAVYNNSPAAITLMTTGEHYFTSTYNYSCEFGQKLAINVTGTGSGTGSTPSSPGFPSSGPTAAPPSVGAAPSRISSTNLLIVFTIAMAVF